MFSQLVMFILSMLPSSCSQDDGPILDPNLQDEKLSYLEMKQREANLHRGKITGLQRMIRKYEYEMDKHLVERIDREVGAIFKKKSILYSGESVSQAKKRLISNFKKRDRVKRKDSKKELINHFKELHSIKTFIMQQERGRLKNLLNEEIEELQKEQEEAKSEVLLNMLREHVVTFVDEAGKEVNNWFRALERKEKNVNHIEKLNLFLAKIKDIAKEKRQKKEWLEESDEDEGLDVEREVALLYDTSSDEEEEEEGELDEKILKLENELKRKTEKNTKRRRRHVIQNSNILD